MIYSIQALRGFTALLVVLVHLGHGPLARYGRVFALGHSGVDLFFVISGFVMVHTVARRPTTPGAFLLNRAIRIVPVYWLLTGVLIALTLIGLPAMQDAPLTWWRAIASLCFIPYAYGTGMPVLYVGWTLDYEMAFYLLFALAIALGGGRLARTIGIAVGAIAVSVLLGALLRPANVYARFFTNPMMLEFGYGMLLAPAYARGWLPARSGAAMILGGVAIGVAIAVLDLGLHTPATGLAALLVVAGTLAAENRPGAAWTRARWAQLFGGASYVLYLIHPFVVSVGIKALDHLHAPALVTVGAIAVVALTVPVAILFHLAVERPIAARLRRFGGHRRSVVDRAEDGIVAGAKPATAGA